MTRKDFELIAETIKGLNYLPEIEHGWVAHDFADKLAETNAAFNRKRFLKATGTIPVGKDFAREVHDAHLRNGNLD